jgi:predicted PurR-regulated permease PerM
MSDTPSGVRPNNHPVWLADPSSLNLSRFMGNQTVQKVWVVAFFVAAFIIVWFTRKVILLLFAALLIALVLTSLANLLRRVMPFLGRKTGLLAVLVLLGGVVTGVSLLVGPSVIDQVDDLTRTLPPMFAEFMERVQKSKAVEWVQRFLPDVEDMAGEGQGVGGAFASTFEAITSFTFIVFSALFLAAAPDLYIRMLIRLFPPEMREDVGGSLARVIETLKGWLFGQLISMIFVGVLTGVALAIAGIPLALVLGVLAGLGEFIPFIGPLLVSMPALLFALSESTNKFLVVLVIIMVIQVLESNVIVPIVQRKVIHMPPVVTLTSMLFLGGMFGLLGLFVAAPLVAMVLVLIEEWHLKRNLHTKEALLD